jgi:hypothetical protein
MFLILPLEKTGNGGKLSQTEVVSFSFKMRWTTSMLFRSSLSKLYPVATINFKPLKYVLKVNLILAKNRLEMWRIRHRTQPAGFGVGVRHFDTG